MAKTIDLSKLHTLPKEEREAIAFYTSFTTLPVHFNHEERMKHYSVLEKAGYIESIGSGGENHASN